MGTVWAARDESTGSDVALKVPNEVDEAYEAESTESFLFEATVAASVCHPAVVRVLHFGVAGDDRPFIAMERLRGRTLREVLRRTGGMRAVDAVRLLLPILEGLRCAHARGIVHGDVKPENILVAGFGTDAGAAKLIDFGVATMDGKRPQATGGDYVVGSFGYMSPEQTRGSSDVDARADLWSFVVVLYEAIRGVLPWKGQNGIALQRAIVGSKAPSLVGVGGVDEALWKVVERGFEKPRGTRWQSSSDLIEALSGWLRARVDRAEVAPARDSAMAHVRPLFGAERSSLARTSSARTLRSATFADGHDARWVGRRESIAREKAYESRKAAGYAFSLCAAVMLFASVGLTGSADAVHAPRSLVRQEASPSRLSGPSDETMNAVRGAPIEEGACSAGRGMQPGAADASSAPARMHRRAAVPLAIAGTGFALDVVNPRCKGQHDGS
jgi:hypothetical protein